MSTSIGKHLGEIPQLMLSGENIAIFGYRKKFMSGAVFIMSKYVVV